PKILIWTPSVSTRNVSDTSFLRSFQNYGNECPYECDIDNRQRIDEDDASAIIFHSRTMSLDDLPSRRRMDQIYVWVCREEPSNCGITDLKVLPILNESE
ncbi:hypothetical protein PENTCL1PPCAC_11833, partial [Pristionchus entomophagus]